MRDRNDGVRQGSRRAARPRAGAGRQTVALVAGTALAGVAWLGLVLAAVRFGQAARGGQGSAWFFMALASLGAAACLFLALLLAWRVSQARAARRSTRPPTGSGGKRSRGQRARR